MNDGTRVGVLGAGAWGTALAILVNRAGSDVTLWSRNDNVISSISNKRVNNAYLPDCFIDPDIKITDDLAYVCQRSDYILLTVPAQSMRAIAIAVSDLVSERTPLVLCSKGIERGSLMLMHEVVGGILPHNPLAVISGPNFAREIAEGKPAATVIATENPVLADKLGFAVGGTYFRPYFSDDIAGVEVGGAVKNVIAIAAGICAGREMGENARAAMITRGLQEMARLAEVKGGRAEIMSGLAGIGDLMLTCSSLQSRNMSLGYNMAKRMPDDTSSPEGTTQLAEGFYTAESVYFLSKKQGVNMPICSTVYRVLQGEIEVDEAIEGLLARPFGTE